MKSLYPQHKCSLRINEQYTDILNVTQGVKQGFRIPSTLMSLFINDLGEGSALKCGKTVSAEFMLSFVLYADGIVLIVLDPDDIVLIVLDPDFLQKMILHNWLQKLELEVNS